MRKDEDKLIKEIFEKEYWKKEKRETKKTWTREVHIAAEKKGTKWENVETKAKNRKKRTQLCIKLPENSTPI